MKTMKKDHLILPHGGILIDLFVNEEQGNNLKNESTAWKSWDLTPRQICDLELILTGAMSPLQGFMTRKDYTPVLEQMRLSTRELWPIPLVLDVTEDFAKELKQGEKIALRDPEGVMYAALQIEDIWKPDRKEECQKVYGTVDPAHPGVHFILNKTNPWYVGGRLEGVQSPVHYDFVDLRLTPKEVREVFIKDGWKKIVAFQTRNPMHRAHFHISLAAAIEQEANLLVHPVVGLTKPGDIDHFVRVRCYQALLPHYPPDTAKLSLLPLAMRMAGPREALWHAIIRKNYGCTHFIIGRDHAGPGTSPQGHPWYGIYDAQNLVQSHENELEIKVVPFKDVVYVEELEDYITSDKISPGMKVLSLSGTDQRNRLALGKPLPEWFTFPKIAKELYQAHPPRNKQGFTIFFTGLSGSGKSTIARVLQVKLMEIGTRPITLLDGDLVRKHLSSELTFSKEHRDLNILRIGFVASEITKNGGIAICAPIAPYDSIRKSVRDMIKPGGGFILVHCSTPLEVCESRDRKGLYAKARKGIIPNFTGISDPYEIPEDADIILDTSDAEPEEEAEEILLHLKKEGYLGEEVNNNN